MRLKGAGVKILEAFLVRQFLGRYDKIPGVSTSLSLLPGTNTPEVLGADP